MRKLLMIPLAAVLMVGVMIGLSGCFWGGWFSRSTTEPSPAQVGHNGVWRVHDTSHVTGLVNGTKFEIKDNVAVVPLYGLNVYIEVHDDRMYLFSFRSDWGAYKLYILEFRDDAFHALHLAEMSEIERPFIYQILDSASGSNWLTEVRIERVGGGA